MKISAKGRVVNIYNKRILIVFHNEKHYRLSFEEKGTINNIGLGDYVSFKGSLNNEKKSGFIEVIPESIFLIKKCKLEKDKTHITEATKLKNVKAKMFFHTKMITDTKTITKMKIFDLVLKSIRKTLNENSYIECRTPILNNYYHGGGALPFETYVNYKHKNNYLRPNSFRSMSIFLAGGLEKIFEIGEYFRNGSIGEMSSVPYLAAEIYSINDNFEQMIDFALNVIDQIAVDINNNFEDKIKMNFKKIDFIEYMRKNIWSEFDLLNLEPFFTKFNLEYKINDNYSNINILYNYFKKELNNKKTSNLVLTGLPAGISPFIDKLKLGKQLKRAFVIYKGYVIMEITYNSNDEKSIQEVLDEQVKNASLRNLRTHPGYEHALKMGIPPFATITFSVERFIALLCELENINENFIDM